MSRLRAAVKVALNAATVALAWPCALSCRLERRISPESETVFAFWSHVFAKIPGTPGEFVRRGFYRSTLDYCAVDVTIGYGTVFTHPRVRVESGVYIGANAMIGCAWIRERSMIGSGASVLSGTRLHELNARGRWTSFNHSQLQQISIGPDAWVAERAIVMADVGECAMVAVGAVATGAVAEGVLVAGNPARFARRLRGGPPVELVAARRVDAPSIAAEWSAVAQTQGQP